MRIVFAGTPAFAVPTLESIIAAGHDVAAVYTQPDRPAGRGRKLTASAVKERALRGHLPIEQPGSLKTPESIAKLGSYAPDAMVVVAYGLLLPQQVLDLPRLGCFNVHASLLPRWRGAAPIQRAILAGDTMTGVTIMRMAAGLDTGPMLARATCAISSGTTSRELHDRLASLGGPMLVETLERVARGEAAEEPQDDAAATYARKISREDARIEWDRPAEVVSRQVRAFDSWPGAETSWRGEPLKIWQARVIERRAAIDAGHVIRADGEQIEVACGEGALQLLTLQLPGRKRVTAADFLHAHAFAGESLT